MTCPVRKLYFTNKPRRGLDIELPAPTVVDAGNFKDSALSCFHARILLVDHEDAAASSDDLGTGRLFQCADGVPNFHAIHLLGDVLS